MFRRFLLTLTIAVGMWGTAALLAQGPPTIEFVVSALDKSPRALGEHDGVATSNRHPPNEKHAEPRERQC